MGLTDILLFFLYVFLFHLFFTWRRRKLKDPFLKKYHLLGFWFKIFATIASTIFNYYISVGDSTLLYYAEGLNIYRMIIHNTDNIKWLLLPGSDFDYTLAHDSWNVGYFPNAANFFIIKLVAIFSFLGFGRYSVVQLFFSMVAFSGIWKLYQFFYKLVPNLHKQFAIALLFFPTLIFWSSGVLKDSICIGMLGWLTYSLYSAYKLKHHIVRNIIIAIFSGYALLIVKPYILFAYLPFLILYFIQTDLYQIKNIFLKAAAIMLILIISIGGFFLITDRLQEEMGFLALEKLTESLQTQQNSFKNMSDQAGSSFTLGVEYDGTLGSLAKSAPEAINATLFRPYIWESKKISTLLSSIESLCLMLFTLYVLYKVRPDRFVKLIFFRPLIFFCLAYSIIFSLFIGITTLNFGTLVRYKIPAIPFYVIAMMLILYYHSIKKAKPRVTGGLDDENINIV